MAKPQKTLIGDRYFYKRTLSIAVPIMIQNGITNFVSLLDNIMVGRIGTEQMSGVAIVNQLLMIYYLCIFGGIAGAGIFTAQYFGEKNDEGIRQTMRFKFWTAIITTAVAMAIFILFGNNLIGAYLMGSNDGGDMAAALSYGRSYINIMMIGFIPFMILQVYAGTLRECNETVLPMKASILAVIVNLMLNYVLIYGKLGFPALGVKGAAIATVTARYVEAATVIIYTHTKTTLYPFIKGLYKTLLIPLDLSKKFFAKGFPLLINEALWSGGVAMLSQCYSTRGLSVVAGLNIANTIYNVFSVVFIAMGNAVSIIVGQLLGAKKMDEARDTDRKLIAFAVASCTAVAIVLLCAAPFFPKLYNTTEQARTVAMQFIIAQALFMPKDAFLNAAYFTLRSGGKTIVTFLFDSVFMWVVSVALAFILSRFTGIGAIYMFLIIQTADFIKCAIGYILVKKGFWIQNITN